MPTFEDFLSRPIETLERALHIRKQIAALEEGLKELMRPNPVSVANERDEIKGRKRERTMSAAARAKIANAQRLRWAKSKGLESATPAGSIELSPVSKTRKKRTMSAAGRAQVAAAQRERWAKQKGSTPAKAAPVAKSKKPRFSAAHRAKLAEAAKARWAKVKAQKSATTKT